MRTASLGLICALACGFAQPATLAAEDPAAARALAHDILKELIEINTTDTPAGNVTTAAVAMQKRLLAAGYAPADVILAGPNDRKQNLVVRLHGSGGRMPILLLGHLDVVEARREDWTSDPFKFVERDGYYYGRGAEDMKEGDAFILTTMIRLKQENYRPDRDLIAALTADEEGGVSNGVDWLVRNRRAAIAAEYVINLDGTSVMSEHGKPQYFEVDATEKVYADYELTVTNKGGHSSLPVPGNAIYALTGAISRIGRYEFPFELNAVTRAYYEQMAKVLTGQRAADMRAILRPSPDPMAIERLARDMVDHATMHTTCVATRLAAGHANNALPQKAQAVVNCRILPGHSPEEVRQNLVQIVADPKIAVRYIDNDGKVLDKASDSKGYAPAVLSPEIFAPLEKLVASTWPGIKVAPAMVPGASDGVITMAAGMPTFIIGPIQIDRDDIRAHGRDERVGVQAFYTGNEFFYRYIKALSAP